MRPSLLRLGGKNPPASAETENSLTGEFNTSECNWDLQEAPFRAAPVTKIPSVQMLLLASPDLVKQRLQPILSLLLKNFQEGDLSAELSRASQKPLFSAASPFGTCIMQQEDRHPLWLLYVGRWKFILLNQQAFISVF